MRAGSAPDRRIHGRMRRRGMLAAAASVVLGAVLALAPALSASAHDYPVTWSPTPGSTVATPLKKVSITFDDIVLNLSGDSHTSLLQVTGPGSATRHFETACTTTVGRKISVPVSLGPAGKYTVAYQIVSADGHVVSGSDSFRYEPPAGTTAAKGTAQPACAEGGPSAASSSAAAPNNSNGSSPGSSSLGIVIAIVSVIVGLAVIAVIVVLVTAGRGSGRRPTGASGTSASGTSAATPDDARGGSMESGVESGPGDTTEGGNARGGRRGKSRWRPDEE